MRGKGGGKEPLVFMDTLIEESMYSTEYDPSTGRTKVVVNMCTIPKDAMEPALTILKEVMIGGIVPSPYIGLCDEGEEFHGFKVPSGHFSLITVCSITLCGLILKAGIPVKPRLGGIVDIVDCEARRFTQVMGYSSTTVDPLEAMLSQRLTSVMSMVGTGTGKILASLHECPIAARDSFQYLLESLSDVGLTGVLEVGEPNAQVLGVPVMVDHFGFVLVGGTNPMAALQEAGIPITPKTAYGVVDMSELGHFEHVL